MDPTATFFLSPGRCGTQWLTQHLQHALGPLAEVTHEPLDDRYEARRMRGVTDPAVVSSTLAERLEAHALHIEQTLLQRSYCETGFPCWSSLPYLLQRFVGRIQIVHVTRHPVPSALSWMAHAAYQPPLLPHLPSRIPLLPTDPGGSFPRYASRWSQLSRYERCLYYWTEVHRFALDLQATATVPWFTLRFESMFAPDGCAALHHFLTGGPPPFEPPPQHEVVDAFHFHFDDWTDPAAIQHHPTTCAVAHELGYAPLDFDVNALRRRYQPHRVASQTAPGPGS